ncbi:MAG: hypothetical protein LUD47_02185 [Clostridia bacterium]|nr:hypothetical protein [Clostridia bacterium]
MAYMVYLDGQEIKEDDPKYHVLERTLASILEAQEDVDLAEGKLGKGLVHDGTRFDIVSVSAETEGVALQEILNAFWKYRQGYSGDIKTIYLGETETFTLYCVETESGRYVAAMCGLNFDLSDMASGTPDRGVVFYTVCSKHGKILGPNEEGTNVEYVDMDGVVQRVDAGQGYMRPAELAAESGKSVTRIYQIAKKLGRLPTLDELKRESKPTGRPRKY